MTAEALALADLELTRADERFGHARTKEILPVTTLTNRFGFGFSRSGTHRTCTDLPRDGGYTPAYE